MYSSFDISLKVSQFDFEIVKPYTVKQIYCGMQWFTKSSILLNDEKFVNAISAYYI